MGRRLFCGAFSNGDLPAVVEPSPVEKPPKTYLFGESSRAHRTTGAQVIDLSKPALAILGKWDFAGVEERFAELSSRPIPGMEVTILGTAEGHPIHRVRIPAIGEPKLRVLITGGVHGREPAGVAGAFLAIDEILANPERRKDVEYTVIPLVGPWGYIHRKRNNRDDDNLNRFFLDTGGVPEEVKVVRGTLNDRRYDLAIDLHSAEVPERGFFALHRGGLDVLGPAIERFRKKHPVLTGQAEPYVEDSPGIYTSKNAGTLKDYMVEKGTIWSFTIESPLKMVYENQVRGHAYMVDSLVERARALQLGLSKAA